MDFFKSCTTNVQVVEDVPKTRFRLYRPDDSNSEMGIGAVFKVLRELRRKRVLCAYRNAKIWTFGADNIEIEDVMCSFGMMTLDEGSIHEQDIQGLDDLFLEAVQGGIGYSLAQTYGATRAGAWTWIYQGSNEIEASVNVAITVRANITANGALHVATQVDRLQVVALTSRVDDISTEVLLAPSGSLANIVDEEAESSLEVMDGASWRESVCDALAAEGMVIDDDTEWSRVLPIEGNAAAFSWPTTLIFTHQSPAFDGLNGGPDAWTQWFSDDRENNGYQDLIQQAEDCQQNAAEPESDDRIVTDHATAAPSTGSAIGSSTNYLGADLAISPPFMPRPEQQVGGIYPTPPDGMMPVVSSQPQVTEPAAAKTTASVEQSGADLAEDVDTVMPDSTVLEQGVKTNCDFSLTSSTGDVQTMQETQDELFGEVGDSIDFGENEVGDADFSFFDEPDDAAGQIAEANTSKPDESLDTQQIFDGGTTTQETELPSDPSERDTGIVINGSEVKIPQDCASEPQDTRSTSAPAVSQERAVSPIEETKPLLAKPLSPFDIKERLFPPPIPASAMQQEQQSPRPTFRRNSSFAPIVFREGYSLSSQYKFDEPMAKPSSRASPGLAAKRKPVDMGRSTKNNVAPEDSDYDSTTGTDVSSEIDSNSSAQEDQPPRFPWETNKKRRYDSQQLVNATRGQTHDEAVGVYDRRLSISEMEDFLAALSNSSSRRGISNGQYLHQATRTRQSHIDAATFFELDGHDLIGIAQIIAGQAATTTDTLAAPLGELERLPEEDTIPEGQMMLYGAVSESLRSILRETKICDISKLALVRENAPLRMNSAQAGKGQPLRGPQRAETSSIGADISSVAPPYVRIQRGDSHWEMLPPALAFWDTLSLAPASGPKDVQTFCVCPSNVDLEQVLEAFFDQLAMTYESCKLGSHKRSIHTDKVLGDCTNAMAKVDSETDSFEITIKSYANVSRKLGTDLAQIGESEPDRTLVIYMIDPFDTEQSRMCLCVCFWLLYKAYRNTIGSNKSRKCSDLVLQILPINIVAHQDLIVVLDFGHMAALAREVYDRCPPTSTLEYPSPLPIVAAPAVELASPPPKRITFQLVPDPPGDLLYDGSALHLAYSKSADEQWISATWMDSSGRYFSSSSFCLRGTHFASVAEDLWERTTNIMSARQAMWRVFIVTDSKFDESQQQCWKTTVSKPRKQVFSVTLLWASRQSTVQVMPSHVMDVMMIRDGLLSLGAGFPTPASTPQASNLGVSPEASGQGNSYAAPPTPAPSEVSANPESEPDAQLVDSTDESWAVLLDPCNLPSVSDGINCLAIGALLKRGGCTAPAVSTSTTSKHINASNNTNYNGLLPILSVGLVWTIQVRPGNVTEGSTRHGEMALREVLHMFRSLSLLTKARDPHRSEAAVVPWHLDCAIRSAKALNRFL